MHLIGALEVIQIIVFMKLELLPSINPFVLYFLYATVYVVGMHFLC